VARQSRTIKGRLTVAIVGDGHTEKIYFENVRDTDRPDNLDIFPALPKRIGNYGGVLDKAIALAEDYDKVYALIDMDNIIRQRQQTAYHLRKKVAEEKGVIVLENNPCFEIWLLLHFTYTTRLFQNCDEVAIILKRDHIPEYDKSMRFVTAANLYRNYKQQLTGLAIPNGRSLEDNRTGQDELFPRAETYKFFEWYFR